MPPNVPKKQSATTKKGGGTTVRRRRGKNPGSAGGGTRSGPHYDRIPFHGSFKQKNKTVNASDLGISAGTTLFVSAVHLEMAVDGPAALNVRLTDFASLAGSTEDTIGGPSSQNVLVSPGAVSRLTFRNPNPRLYWTIESASADIFDIHCTSDTYTVTFTGWVEIWYAGQASHGVS